MKDTNATVIVNLESSEEEIMKNLHKDARWGINRAIREGLVVEPSEDFNLIYDLYKETVLLGGTNPESVEKLKQGTKVMFICKKDNKIIATAGIEMKNSKPTLYFNASLKEYQNMQPNNLLYWECIKWCKKNGFKEFDLGGWQINARGHLDGVNKFKEKWGKIVYYKEDYSPIRAIGRKLIRNSGFFWWLNKKLRGRK